MKAVTIAGWLTNLRKWKTTTPSFSNNKTHFTIKRHPLRRLNICSFKKLRARSLSIYIDVLNWHKINK